MLGRFHERVHGDGRGRPIPRTIYIDGFYYISSTSLIERHYIVADGMVLVIRSPNCQPRELARMINNAVDIECPHPAGGLARNPSIKLFAGLAAINFFRIGYQLVVVAWSTVQSTGRADAAGKILLI